MEDQHPEGNDAFFDELLAAIEPIIGVDDEIPVEVAAPAINRKRKREAEVQEQSSEPRKKRPYKQRKKMDAETRKERKKEQNKIAAQKYRAKVKEEEARDQAELEKLIEDEVKLTADIMDYESKLISLMEGN